MSEASERSIEQEQELRRRFGSGDDKLTFDDSSVSKPDNQPSPADSDNDQRIGTDSDHVRKKIIDFFATTSSNKVKCFLIRLKKTN